MDDEPITHHVGDNRMFGLPEEELKQVELVIQVIVRRIAPGTVALRLGATTKNQTLILSTLQQAVQLQSDSMLEGGALIN